MLVTHLGSPRDYISELYFHDIAGLNPPSSTPTSNFCRTRPYRDGITTPFRSLLEVHTVNSTTIRPPISSSRAD
jgi:hypothetical protein